MSDRIAGARREERRSVFSTLLLLMLAGILVAIAVSDWIAHLPALLRSVVG